MAAQVRARHMKSLLAWAATFAPLDGAGISERVSARALRAIDEAAGPEWMPFELNLELTRAIHDALGRAEFEAFFRGHQLESFRGPLLRAFVDGVVSLFGIAPGSWLRMVPRGWGLVFRDCGEWTPVRDVAPGHSEIALAALPPEAVVDDVWPRSVAASISATIDLARTTGAMTVERLDAVARTVHFALRWRKRP
jgi:hypothetical protein